MGTQKVENVNQSQEDVPSVNPNSDSFKFETWAIAVRYQMLAALEKRWRSSQAKIAHLK